MRAENASSAGSEDRAVLADEHELEVAACDAQLDVRGVELVVELERRLGEGVLDSPAEGRLDRDREEVGRARRVLVAECRNADRGPLGAPG